MWRGREPDLWTTAAPGSELTNAEVLDWSVPLMSLVPISPAALNKEISARNHVSIFEYPRSRQFRKGGSWPARADWDGSCTGGWRRARCVSRG